ncbi:MAG: ABC transporter ATP-binding protein [Gammaproteobacteria bacterium]|nr:ABC transporter ATP-binding protein [Gammaproteobacteria bacterium]
MIALAGITKTFVLGDQTVHAVVGVDLNLRAGEYVSIMGPSGSGKSTLLNLIALLDRPSSGAYCLNGVDVTTLDDNALAAARSRSIGFVFQFFHLVPRMTAAQNVELPLTLAGVAASQRARRVSAVLADLGLADRAHHRPNELSGGQRQRVAIARATIMKPAILLADEPTGNLDSASGAQVIDILEGLHSREGVTLIVVTHDPALGRRASRQIGLADGRIAHDVVTGGRAPTGTAIAGV